MLLVTALLDHIRGLHQKWFLERRTLESKRETILLDCGEELMGLVDMTSRIYIMRPNDHHELEIMDGHCNPCVNLHVKTCMCGEFDYDIPCAHALAGFRVSNIDPYTLCFSVYTVLSLLLTRYAEPIFPLCHISEWKTTPKFVDRVVLHPKVVGIVSRRPIVRIPSAGEIRKTDLQMSSVW